MTLRISAVIPARNEAGTIAHIVSNVRKHPSVDEVLVVDSASDDDTGHLARAAGAHVIRLEIPGFGRAVKAGAAAARNKWIFKLDGDMRNASTTWVSSLLEKARPGVGLVKAHWSNFEDHMPVTNLVVRPSINIHIPELSYIHMPISGVYLYDKSLICGDALPDDFAHDLDILVRMHRLGVHIEQVYLGEVLDRLNPVLNYVGMAEELLRYLQTQSDLQRCTPLMMIMAHPDDAEIWCGGTLAKILAAGGLVKLWIAATTLIRMEEAMKLAERHRNLQIDTLGHSDFGQIADKKSISKIAADIARFRPRTIITHHHSDDHPDHRACYNVVTGACLKVDRHMLPHNIYLCNTYFQETAKDGAFSPNTFIDISQFSDVKYTSIANHQSQDTEHWVRLARAIDELNGSRCGVARAEAFQKVNIYTSPHADAYLS